MIIRHGEIFEDPLHKKLGIEVSLGQNLEFRIY